MKNNDEFIRGIYEKASLAEPASSKKRKTYRYRYYAMVTATLLILFGISIKIWGPINENLNESLGPEPMVARYQQDDQPDTIYAEATILDTTLTTEGCRFHARINQETTSIKSETLDLFIDSLLLNNHLNGSLDVGDVVSLWLTPSTNRQLPYEVLAISKLQK
ncbi:MAG: hypothetical protein ACLRZ7_09395 [Lachnospiraceae bacterium]